jgi:hypothetical protein
MVRPEKFEEREIFVCEACDLGYADEETAKACEEWCIERNSCNLEIIRKAVKR